MKVVSFITSDEIHGKKYNPILRKIFKRYSTSEDLIHDVDAIVYDIIDWMPEIDAVWLEKLDIPVVVLTSENLTLAETAKRIILKHPVNSHQIVDALERMGIKGEKEV